MRTIWHSLAWKEWHEHKWKLASIVAILWGVTSLAMLEDKRDTFGLAFGLLVMCIVPLAIFVGLGAAANERSRGTLAFTQSLPVPMWRVACSKLLFGFVTLAAPIMLTVALFYVWTFAFDLLGVDYRPPARDVGANGLSTGIWYLDILLLSAPLAASFFIWAAAAGVNRKDEVSAGAVALAVMVGWCVLLMLAGYILFAWKSFETPQQRSEWITRLEWIKVVGLSTAPGGFAPAIGITEGTPRLLPLGIFTAVVVHLALAIWYVRSFGRVANLEIRSPQIAAREAGRTDWLAPPRRSQLTAVVWKQFRESGPIVLVGLAGVVGIVLLFMAAERIVAAGGTTYTPLGMIYARVAIVFGFVVALVVGIGVCLHDVAPQLSTFWRSRPINPDLWFWTKFGTGLMIVLAAIYVPILLVTLPVGLDNLWDPDVSFIPTLHIAVFAAAVMTTCLVRHAVYAAILSIAVVYLGVLTVLATWLAAGMLGLVRLNPVWWEPTEMQVAAGLLISFFASTLIAWLAVRYDWGWKSRY